MKITEIKSAIYEMEPSNSADFRYTRIRITQVFTDEGVTGYGFCDVDNEALIKEIKPALIGKDPRNIVPSPVSECTEKLKSNRKIYGSTPHMHQLGTKVSVWHTSAATKVKTNLSDRSLWNFDNQTTDWLSTPIDAKSGDTISISCTFDVGLRSLLPMYKDVSPNYIVWGEGTRDEMCLGIINYTE
jgi:hypothetical protein